MRILYSSVTLVIFCLLYFTAIPSTTAQSCWSPLGPGIGTSTGSNVVTAMTHYNGNIIVAGKFDTIGGVVMHNIASWNGSSWSPLGSGIKVPGYKRINALVTYNGALYAAGYFDTAGGVNVQSIAKWDGNVWSPAGPLASGNHVNIEAMAIHQSALYVGGYFDSIGGVLAAGISKWDGNSWSALGAGIRFGNGGDVQSLASINNLLYVGGNFIQAGPLHVSCIASWDGSSWSALGGGLDSFQVGGVTSIAQYQGEVYASVLSSDTANAVNAAIYYVAKWNGTSWSYVVGDPNLRPFKYGDLFALLPYDGKLIAGGFMQFISTDTISAIASWNGSSWSGMDGGIPARFPFQEVGAMDTLNGHLFVAGSFDHLGGTAVLNVAEYSCQNVAVADVAIDQISIYPNPSRDKLYINTSLADIDLTISDITGRVYTIPHTQTGIDISLLSPGVYCLHLYNKSGITVRRFVKE